MLNLPRFTLYGAALGAGLSLINNGASEYRGMSLGMVARDIALCSTVSAAAFLIGGAIHNHTSKHNREERERARAVANKDIARTV